MSPNETLLNELEEKLKAAKKCHQRDEPQALQEIIVLVPSLLRLARAGEKLASEVESMETPIITECCQNQFCHVPAEQANWESLRDAAIAQYRKDIEVV